MGRMAPSEEPRERGGRSLSWPSLGGRLAFTKPSAVALVLIPRHSNPEASSEGGAAQSSSLSRARLLSTFPKVMTVSPPPPRTTPEGVGSREGHARPQLRALSPGEESSEAAVLSRLLSSCV